MCFISLLLYNYELNNNHTIFCCFYGIVRLGLLKISSLEFFNSPLLMLKIRARMVVYHDYRFYWKNYFSMKVILLLMKKIHVIDILEYGL